MDISVRKQTLADTDELERVYNYARGYMKRTGNPNQWLTHPDREELERDAATGNGYVIECDGRICGAFAFFTEPDPTYSVIDGEWLNAEPYGTIHRVASDGTVRGLLGVMIDYCAAVIPNLRMDTHNDNKVMQHLLDKYGFKKCGTVYIIDDFSDHSPRIAYQILK